MKHENKGEKITIEEEIFCKYFMNTGLNIESAYYAGMYNNIKDQKTLDQLTLVDRKMLSIYATKARDKKEVRAYLSRLIDEYIKNNKIASNEEIQIVLTSILRASKDNNYRNQFVKNGLVAADLLMKHFGSNKGPVDKYIFIRE